MEEWKIQVSKDRTEFIFSRSLNGIVQESYKPTNQSEASVWVSAIIVGFEPPRSLVCQDRLVEKTPSEHTSLGS